ncbi:aldo/keto reductase [Lentisphaerota bacterium]|nr:aldo/keto reductase [Lentisphaerota bacterium]
MKKTALLLFHSVHWLDTLRALDEVARKRSQSIAQLAVAWLLKDKRITSVLTGARQVSQIENDVAALNNLEFSATELKKNDFTLQNRERRNLISPHCCLLRALAF